MRYSVLGFNQEKLIQYDIDMTDVLLLDYIQRALSQPSMVKTFEEEQPYVWLNHAKILEDLPILHIKEDMLKKRIANLVKLGLIKSITIANTAGRGSRAYYTITEAFEELQFSDEDMTKCKKLSLVEQPSVKNYTSNNKLTKDKELNKNTNTIVLVEKKPKSSKPNLYQKCFSAIEEFTDDTEVRDCLDNYLRFRLEIKDKPLYANQFKGILNKLRELTESKTEALQIIQQSIDKGYLSFYPITRSAYNNVKSAACEANVSCATMSEEEQEAQNRFIEQMREAGKQVEF